MLIAIYCRVSTRDQNINTQLIPLKEYAERMGYKVFETYQDVGISGTKDSRPAFDKLLRDMRQGKFEAILTYKLDRIGRSLRHLLDLFSEFKNRNIEFIAYSQSINTGTAEGKMFSQMLMVLAEYERELLISRINDGLIRARKEGKKLGRPHGSKDRKRRRKGGYYLRYALKSPK